MRAYFQAVATALDRQGEGYGIGGDEVMAVLPSLNTQEAVRSFGGACRLLMGGQLKLDGIAIPSPSISVGVVAVTDPRVAPEVIRCEADLAMYRAKERAHQVWPNPSVIAVCEAGVVTVIGFEDEPFPQS